MEKIARITPNNLDMRATVTGRHKLPYSKLLMLVKITIKITNFLKLLMRDRHC